jgi:hypothetical protein
MENTMMHELGERVARLSLEDLTSAARDRLLLCLFANFVVGVAGPRYSVIPEPRGAGPYRLLTGATSPSAHDAMFYNAATMHARTQDDFDSDGNIHAGTVVVPALMAIADGRPISGKDFLEGIAAGYLIAVSFARMCSKDTTPRACAQLHCFVRLALPPPSRAPNVFRHSTSAVRWELPLASQPVRRRRGSMAVTSGKSTPDMPLEAGFSRMSWRRVAFGAAIMPWMAGSASSRRMPERRSRWPILSLIWTHRPSLRKARSSVSR